MVVSSVALDWHCPSRLWNIRHGLLTCYELHTYECLIRHFAGHQLVCISVPEQLYHRLPAHVWSQGEFAPASRGHAHPLHEVCVIHKINHHTLPYSRLILIRLLFLGLLRLLGRLVFLSLLLFICCLLFLGR